MYLTFTTLWANSANDKLTIFFLPFPEKKICHFMQIVSIGDNLHEMSICLCWGFTAQSTQWGHVERGQFT